MTLLLRIINLFEILKSDLAGRIGVIHTNHGKIETPAYVPVIHPVKQTIPSKKIKEMGFDLVITNAYITRNNYGDEAVIKGIHKIIDFDGAIMTDSGGYQVLEYGDVKVLPSEMADFEKKINKKEKKMIYFNKKKLRECGKKKLCPKEMEFFKKKILTDFAIPLDKP